jgi:hypothetical protein
MQTESSQHSVLPSQGRNEIFPPFIKQPAFSKRGVIFPQALLDYVVPSRADDVACSPGGAVVPLVVIRCLPGLGQECSSQRFPVHEFGWVQNFPGACRTCSAVLCIEFLFFRNRKKKEKIK